MIASCSRRSPSCISPFTSLFRHRSTLFAYIHSPSQIPFFSSFPVESGLDTLLPCNRRFLSRCRLSRQHHMVRSIGTATGRRSFPLHTQATTADSRQLPIVCARRSSLIGLNCSRQLNQRAAAASTCLRTGTSTSTVERTEIQLLGTAACAGVKDAGVPLTASDRVAGRARGGGRPPPPPGTNRRSKMEPRRRPLRSSSFLQKTKSRSRNGWKSVKGTDLPRGRPEWTSPSRWVPRQHPI